MHVFAVKFSKIKTQSMKKLISKKLFTSNYLNKHFGCENDSNFKKSPRLRIQ